MCSTCMYVYQILNEPSRLVRKWNIALFPTMELALENVQVVTGERRSMDSVRDQFYREFRSVR